MSKMLTKDEFDSIVHEFIGELWATFEGQSAAPLQPAVAQTIEEVLFEVQRPELSPQERVATAFAVVHQYLESTWPDRVEEGYQLYCKMRQQGGRV